MERPERHHTQFLREKGKIDDLYSKGYKITAVIESNSGALVEFSRVTKENCSEKEELQIDNADTRKYFSNLIIAEQKAQQA